MKKTYQNPTTKIVKIQIMQMIAASLPEGYNKSLNKTGGSGSGALSRDGGSFWDDDDFDE